MIYLELRFPFTGNSLPSDQGYALFSAISRVIPEVHESTWFALETLPGTARGNGTTQLDSCSRLKLRAPQDRVPLLLKLAGKRLDVRGHAIRLGPPQIYLLRPSPDLYSRCVTIKKFMEPEPFLDAVRRKLDELEVKGQPEVGTRRAFRVGNHTIVGFGLTLRDLSDEASLLVQERGIGGRRHMGCGIFNPISEKV